MMDLWRSVRVAVVVFMYWRPIVWCLSDSFPLLCSCVQTVEEFLQSESSKGTGNNALEVLNQGGLVSFCLAYIIKLRLVCQLAS